MRWLGAFTLVVLAAGCRLRFDAQANGDADIDGHPLPTCTGHDEDGDGFPDACDVCPTVVDPDQLDRGEILAGNTADGVGDACDPRPSLAGDYIEVFDPHTDAATPTYYNINGTRSWTGDSFRMGAVGSFAQADYVLPAPATRLETRMHVLAASTTQAQWMGIWYTDNLADNRRAFAQVADDPTDAVDVEMYIKQDDNAAITFSPYLHSTPKLNAGDTYTFVVVTALATGSEDTMAVTSPTGTETTSMTLSVPRDRYGFVETVEIELDCDYFIAYAIR